MSTRTFGPICVTPRPISRRSFLRGAGVALSLPWLNAMSLPTARAAASPAAAGATPRRLFAICNNLGLRPDLFFPVNAGRDYQDSPYL